MAYQKLKHDILPIVNRTIGNMVYECTIRIFKYLLLYHY